MQKYEILEQINIRDIIIVNVDKIHLSKAVVLKKYATTVKCIDEDKFIGKIIDLNNIKLTGQNLCENCIIKMICDPYHCAAECLKKKELE